MRKLSTLQLQAADVSGDGLVTTDDAKLILQRWTEIINQFPFATEDARTVTVSIPNVEGKQGQTVPASIVVDDVTAPVSFVFLPAMSFYKGGVLLGRVDAGAGVIDDGHGDPFAHVQYAKLFESLSLFQWGRRRLGQPQ